MTLECLRVLFRDCRCINTKNPAKEFTGQFSRYPKCSSLFWKNKKRTLDESSFFFSSSLSLDHTKQKMFVVHVRNDYKITAIRIVWLFFPLFLLLLFFPFFFFVFNGGGRTAFLRVIYVGNRLEFFTGKRQGRLTPSVRTGGMSQERKEKEKKLSTRFL